MSDSRALGMLDGRAIVISRPAMFPHAETLV
ncbi:unannotated protein [freshwater metagenome]|uniref:Unannotated protein n=1 Tax=freshwater metagenome TaxID=449393 RepID=A0A6J6GDV3_9ZZZZ